MKKTDAKLAGEKGGRERARRLTQAERSLSAQVASSQRWFGVALKDAPIATHGEPGKNLVIGDAEIACYVLSDGRRVLTQSGMVTGIGMHRPRGDGLFAFASQERIWQFLSPTSQAAISNPIVFSTRWGGGFKGYEATLLLDLCEAILKARDNNLLHPSQLRLAAKCDTIIRATAKVGIIALVDEATGYQHQRVGDELRKLLDRYISEDFRRWTKTFPDDFFRNVFRIHGWPYESGNNNRPQYVGKFINQTIYDAMAPGVKDRLREVNPTNAKGRRSRVHTQHLTEDDGLRDLKHQITKVTTVMELAGDKDQFWEMFGRLQKA